MTSRSTAATPLLALLLALGTTPLHAANGFDTQTSLLVLDQLEIKDTVKLSDPLTGGKTQTFYTCYQDVRLNLHANGTWKVIGVGTAGATSATPGACTGSSSGTSTTGKPDGGDDSSTGSSGTTTTPTTTPTTESSSVCSLAGSWQLTADAAELNGELVITAGNIGYTTWADGSKTATSWGYKGTYQQGQGVWWGTLDTGYKLAGNTGDSLGSAALSLTFDKDCSSFSGTVTRETIDPVTKEKSWPRLPWSGTRMKSTSSTGSTSDTTSTTSTTTTTTGSTGSN